MTRPLANYCVVEAPAPRASTMHRLALALAGKIASDLGADVVKIVPPDGDPLHQVPVLPWENGIAPEAIRDFLDSTKTLVPLDADTQTGDREVERLAKVADVILTDDYALVPPGQPDAASQQVICLLTSFPKDNPLNDVPVSEITMLALSGLLDIVGEPTREPVMLGGHQAAYAAGLSIFSAMMTGIAALESHGVGDILDIDILDALIWVNWKGVSGSRMSPGTETTREGASSEWRVLRAKDGYIALVYNQRNWKAVTDLIGDPMLSNPDLATRSGRAARRSDYMPVIERWCARRTRDEIYHAAQSLRIPVGSVVEPVELRSDPQIAARGTIAETAGVGATPCRMPVLPMIWNGRIFPPVSKAGPLS
ncbi:MAG: CoA transferase [Pseudomonadota bacterium]